MLWTLHKKSALQGKHRYLVSQRASPSVGSVSLA